MNLIDRIVMAFDPKKGIERYYARKKIEIWKTDNLNKGA